VEFRPKIKKTVISLHKGQTVLLKRKYKKEDLPVDEDQEFLKQVPGRCSFPTMKALVKNGNAIQSSGSREKVRECN